MRIGKEVLPQSLVFACHHGDLRSDMAVELFTTCGGNAIAYPGGMRDMVKHSPQEIIERLQEDAALVLIHDALRNAGALDRTFNQAQELLFRNGIPFVAASMDELMYLARDIHEANR